MRNPGLLHNNEVEALEGGFCCSAKKSCTGGTIGLDELGGTPFAQLHAAVPSAHEAQNACFGWRTPDMIRFLRNLWRLRRDTRGSVFIEYLLLCTIVGIGVIVGLATLKEALIAELTDLAEAIGEIVTP